MIRHLPWLLALVLGASLFAQEEVSDDAVRRLAIAKNIDRLAKGDEAQRAAAHQALVAAGARAIPQLVARREAKDEQLRRRVRAVLASLGETPQKSAQRIAALVARVAAPTEEPDAVWMGSEELPSRAGAVSHLREYGDAGLVPLGKLLGQTGGPVTLKLQFEPPRPRPRQQAQIRIIVRNTGKSGVWIRRPLRVRAGWKSLQRHVHLVPEKKAPDTGEQPRPGLPIQLRHYAYLGPGKSLRFAPEVRTASFGKLAAQVDLPGSRLKKALVLGAGHPPLIPHRAAVSGTAEAFVLPPAAGHQEGGLALTLGPGPERPGKLLMTMTLTSTSAKALRVWNVQASRHALWWLVRKKDVMVAHGWLSGRKDSYAAFPRLLARIGMLRILAPKASIVARVAIPRPKAGTYELQIGLGPIASALKSEKDPVWVGELISPAVQVVVK